MKACPRSLPMRNALTDTEAPTRREGPGSPTPITIPQTPLASPPSGQPENAMQKFLVALLVGALLPCFTACVSARPVREGGPPVSSVPPHQAMPLSDSLAPYAGPVERSVDTSTLYGKVMWHALSASSRLACPRGLLGARTFP